MIVNSQQRKISQTEKSVLAQLPEDIFRFNAKALDRAASFGLIPMQEGWIAGGIVGKLVMARMRSEPNGKDQMMRPGFHCACFGDISEPIEGTEVVDPSRSPKSLLRQRTDLMKRGLLP